jgi:hypothetical protein
MDVSGSTDMRGMALPLCLDNYAIQTQNSCYAQVSVNGQTHM